MTTQQKITYITTADTAKALRQALKAAFPKTIFRVRSKTYSGGSSIDVSWTDGPTAKEVERVANHYQGADFDGSQDLRTYRPAQEVGGQLVKYCVNYIFCNRSYSPEFLARRAYCVAQSWGVEVPAVVADTYGARIEGGDIRPGGGHYTLAELVYQAAARCRPDKV